MLTKEINFVPPSMFNGHIPYKHSKEFGPSADLAMHALDKQQRENSNKYPKFIPRYLREKRLRQRGRINPETGIYYTQNDFEHNHEKILRYRENAKKAYKFHSDIQKAKYAHEDVHDRKRKERVMRQYREAMLRRKL